MAASDGWFNRIWCGAWSCRPVMSPAGTGGSRVVSIDDRFGVARVIIAAAQRTTKPHGQIRVRSCQQTPYRRPDQHDRVHRGHRVIQRGGIQHPPPAHQPTSPACRAAVNATSKTRSGRCERRNRSRISTNTLCTNGIRCCPSQPPTPAAYRQRTSKVNRCTASRSDKPSNRCNTITAATTDGGTERRPLSANKSANMASGNNTASCRCRNP